MPEKNLCKKGKSIYTTMIHNKNVDILEQRRERLKADATREEKMALEREYLGNGINFIKTVINNEFKRRKYVVKGKKNEDNKLEHFKRLWEDTNNTLELAFEKCESVDELKRASDRICEIISSLPCKDIRTYNMLPVWDSGRQTMVTNLAVQNYELIIDDFLNKLGSKGMAKLGDGTEKNYTKREKIDEKLEKAVFNLDKKEILKSLKNGAYVDLKLEADDFNFDYKPCTVLNYVLMCGEDDLAIEILKYGANVNIKNMKKDGELFLPILYALEKRNINLIISILNAGAILDKDFIGTDIKESFREILNVDKELSWLNKLNEEVVENAYISDILSIYEVKELLKKDESELLITALENNNSALILKLLSSNIVYRKDSELSRNIEGYLGFLENESDFSDFFGACVYLNGCCGIPKEEIMIRMYIKDLVPIDKIIGIYNKSKKYVLDKILQLGSELLFVNFLKGVVNRKNLDAEATKSFEKYLREMKNEDIVEGLYVNGVISIDFMSSVLNKDIMYFLQRAINKGNDVLIIKLLDSGTHLSKDRKDTMIKLVENYLNEDKERVIKQDTELVDRVNRYKELMGESNTILTRENIGIEKSVSKD